MLSRQDAPCHECSEQCDKKIKIEKKTTSKWQYNTIEVIQYKLGVAQNTNESNSSHFTKSK